MIGGSSRTLHSGTTDCLSPVEIDLIAVLKEEHG
jgi:hypothetical protein